MQTDQRKDPELARLIDFLTDKTLPSDPHDANVVVGLAKKGYYVIDVFFTTKVLKCVITDV